tara:strand:- start:3592 stop:3855 length:264 start_codon:yes stop_codon:yes gene_type:complete
MVESGVLWGQRLVKHDGVHQRECGGYSDRRCFAEKVAREYTIRYRQANGITGVYLNNAVGKRLSHAEISNSLRQINARYLQWDKNLE